mgnify:CR=1 FL=1
MPAFSCPSRHRPAAFSADWWLNWLCTGLFCMVIALIFTVLALLVRCRQGCDFGLLPWAAVYGRNLVVSATIGGLIHLALRTWPKRHGPPVRVHATLPSAQAPQKRRYLRPRTRKALAAALAALALALAAWQAAGVRAAAARHHVGEVQLDRIPNDPAFAIDYAAFLAWARARWDARETDYRIAVRADRNAHWFMDSPVTTHTPTYKLGFTPGDNFVHKPETGDPALLRRLGVRYVGFTIPDDFVIGYGLDVAERYRNLRYLAIYDPDAS